MADGSAIEWTDATWNPVTGCTKVSPGCAHCYIERTPAMRVAGRRFERGTLPVLLHPRRLEQPLKWRGPRRIFVNSLSDLFHEDVPDTFIAQVYGVMVTAYWHTFQVLTKRPERRRQLFSDPEFRRLVAGEASQRINGLRGRGRPQGETRSLLATGNLARWNGGAAGNVWEGVTAENQRFADERIPLLLDTPAAVRFLSCEPLLGPLDFDRYHPEFGSHWLTGLDEHYPEEGRSIAIDWVIVGGESGPGARWFDVSWAERVIQQCQAAGVACYYKQGGYSNRCRHDRKGGHFDCFPEDLQVREFPNDGR